MQWSSPHLEQVFFFSQTFARQLVGCSIETMDRVSIIKSFNDVLTVA